MLTHYELKETLTISCTSRVTSLLGSSYTGVIEKVTCTACIEARITMLQRKGTLSISVMETFELRALLERRDLMRLYPSM